MSQCPHGEMTRREGKSSYGPWVGYFCSLKKGDPQQCQPQFDNKDSKPQSKNQSNGSEHLEQIIVSLTSIEGVLNDIKSILRDQNKSKIPTEDIPF